MIFVLRRVYRGLWALAALGFAIVVAALGPDAWWQITADRRPPLIGISAIAAKNSPVHGRTLIVRVFREKIRNECPVQSSRYATDQNGVIHDLPNARNAGGPASAGHVDLAVDVGALPDGQYVLHMTGRYVCPHLDEPFVYVAPTVNFQVQR